MKLYFNPYGCSLAVVIAATEARIELDLVEVDILKDPHTLADGTDYVGVNAKNYVPALVAANGELLTEVSAILQYLADLRPEWNLAPTAGSWPRTRLQETLNFLGSELHKFYSPWLFHPEVGEVAQDYARAKIASRYALIERQLDGSDYLMGDFSVADAYLFVMVNWAGFAKTPLDAFPNIRAWFDRMQARPAVQEALRLHAGKPKRIAA
ncbi:MAG TPA: glutathione binding-like protein [Devosia sp.]